MDVLLPVVTVIALLTLGVCLNLSTRLTATQRRLDLLLRHLGIAPTTLVGLSDRVKELAQDPSRKIEAIKALRQETGAGLAEAKEAVEAYQRSIQG